MGGQVLNLDNHLGRYDIGNLGGYNNILINDATGTDTINTQHGLVVPYLGLSGGGLVQSDANGNLTTTVGGTGTVTSIRAGTGLTGGTITTSGTIALATVGTAGTYGDYADIPIITTDAEGRVTSVGLAANAPISLGIISSYNSIALSGTGLPIEVAENDLKAQTAAVSSVASYTGTSVTGPERYLVSVYLNVLSVSIDVLNVRVSWTDENGTTQTKSIAPNGAVSPNISTTGYQVFSPIDVSTALSSSVTVSTVLTTSSGSISYDVGATILQTK